MKFLGAIIIVASCVAVGFWLSSGFMKDISNLRQLLWIINELRAELIYIRPPLPRLCRSVAERSEGILKYVLEEFAVQLENQVLPNVDQCMRHTLSCREVSSTLQNCLLHMGQTLGRYDVDGQIQGLNLLESNIRNTLSKLEADIHKTKSYRIFGLCTGAALVILLL